MKPNRRSNVLILALSLSVFLAACGGAASETTTTQAPASSTTSGEATTTTETTVSTETTASGEPFKVAFILLGTAADGGWNLGHDQGRLAVEEVFGDLVETTVKESVPESPQVLQVIDDLVADGNKMIFGTSFGYMDFMLEAAAKYPDVIFEHVTGYKTSENMANYNGAQEDAKYLAGMAAGAVAETGQLGYVAPFAIPLIIKHINAWTLGAQSVNPEATVQVVWLNSWFDPAAERQAAESLISSGAEVIGHSQDTPSACQAAEAAGLFCTGNTTDQSEFTPEAWLTGDVVNWGTYYVERVRQAMEGTWETGANYAGMADGLVELATIGPAVDDETRTAIETAEAGIIDGSLAYLTGPISDQAGEVRVADGVTMTLEEILGWDWFVQGIEGSPTG